MSGKLRIRVASAGTGKTTILVARYLELIAAGVPLRRIAGATFTRASADELRQRVADGITVLLAEGSYLGLVVLQEEERHRFEEARRELPGALLTTISGLMVRFLRLSALQVGLDPEFTMMDEFDARGLFEEEFRSLLLTRDREFDGQELELALQLFQHRSLAGEFQPGDQAATELLELVEAAMQGYNLRLAGRQLGPADVERYAMRLARLEPALVRLKNRYSHLLLDEFQDVNPLQGSFFRSLVGAGLVVEAVGDPKQSIYGFRDADVEVFRRAMADGERLPDLTETRRHSLALTEFLNHATGVMGDNGLGFSAAEAPPVVSAGPQAQVKGSVEVHWVAGPERIGPLRNQEARLLAGLLRDAHAAGTPWEDMAVLARTHASIDIVHRALLDAGVPALIGRGQGFFQRPEIRDVANALRTGVSATGPAFAAWLRSPFAQLDLAESQEVLLAEDRQAALAEIDAGLAAALQRLRELVLLPPQEALKALLREPMARGRRFHDWLGARQRANIDALLVRTVSRPPADLELLLTDLERQARSQVAEVPESGVGVSLVTIHHSKGLEWPLTAIFDTGREAKKDPATLQIRTADGMVALQGSALWQELATERSERDRQELQRMFYVAASRPRDRLIMTGSLSGSRRARDWAALLERLGLGPDAQGARPAGVSVTRHESDAASGSDLPEKRHEAAVLHEADWSTAAFERGRFRPVMSPSSLRGYPGDPADAQPEPAGGESELPGSDVAEPVEQGHLQEDDTVVSRAAAIGTLLHAAIAFDWSAHDPGLTDSLLAQEVMFPFDREERLDIAGQVLKLLAAYEAMLGTQLPALVERQRDEAELPVALPFAGTIWQGTIDRLYQADGDWWLDDYKTDAAPDAELYVFQLAIYFHAAEQALGVTPRARLVWLRHGEVSEIAADTLRDALDDLAAVE